MTLTDIKTELITLIAAQISSLGNRVYPSFNDTSREGQTSFIALDAQIIAEERMVTGYKYTAVVRFMIVAETTLTTDNLSKTLSAELRSHATSYISFHYAKMTSLSEIGEYMPELYKLKARTMDIRVVFFE